MFLTKKRKEGKMEAVGMVIFAIGAIVSIIGGIWFLIVAFRQSVWWGLGCLFVPFVSLVFLIMHWRDAAKPFFVSLLGTAIIVAVAVMMPGAIPTG
jgi:hypothetical protein